MNYLIYKYSKAEMSLPPLPLTSYSALLRGGRCQKLKDSDDDQPDENRMAKEVVLPSILWTNDDDDCGGGNDNG